MPSLYNLVSGAVAQAQDVQQIIDMLKGTAALGIPASLTSINDTVNFALAVKNTDVTNSRALQVLRANNLVMIQADANGVVVSPDGVAAAAQVVNLSLVQTLTNKTLTSPTVTGTLTDSGDLIVNNAGANPASVGANNAIRLPNNQRLAIRNGGNTGDNWLSFDPFDRFVIQGITAAATATNGTGAAVLGNVQEYLTVLYNGNIRKIALFQS